MPTYNAYKGPCSGGPRPGTIALRTEIKNRFPGGNAGYPFGIYNCRPPSEHAEGRALDYGLNASDPAQRTVGDRVAAWLVANADALGVQSVIWNRRVWGFGRWNWRNYTGKSPHTDHVHVGQNLWGAKNFEGFEEDDMAQVSQEDWDKMKADVADIKKALYIGPPSGSGLPPVQLDDYVREMFKDVNEDLAAIKAKLGIDG